LVYLIGLGGLCVPHLCTHSWKVMNTQKHIICINILISWTIRDLYLTKLLIFIFFKCPYIYTLYVYIYSTCTREWSKLVIKTTNGENSYHLCSWHQWPFGASQFWFQKFITKSKLIQSIIYKRHQVGWHSKYFEKWISMKNSQKKNYFCVHD